MQRINLKQNINFQLKNLEMLKQIILIILKLKKLKRKILIVFDDMIADTPGNKTFHPVVTELVIRGRQLKTSPVFIT